MDDSLFSCLSAKFSIIVGGHFLFRYTVMYCDVELKIVLDFFVQEQKGTEQDNRDGLKSFWLVRTEVDQSNLQILENQFIWLASRLCL